MKQRIKGIVIGLIVITSVIILFGCGGRANLNGQWQMEGSNPYNPFRDPIAITFSGNNFEANAFVGNRDPAQWGTNSSNGTFSLTDDHIEFVRIGPTGIQEVRIFSFSRTENTITIGGRRFILQR